METISPVVVKRMPGRLTSREVKAFLRENQALLSVDRPQLVFDMSELRQIDASGVQMLLQCMSEVMKRDGDLKLAAVTPEAAIVLELTRTDRLFEMYHNAADAVRSFTRFMPSLMRNQPFATSPSDGKGNLSTGRDTAELVA